MVEGDRRPKIDGGMMILQVVKHYPETIDVLREAGLQCFNCLLSPFETLEEGAIGHGWAPDAIADLVDRLNAIVASGKDFDGADHNLTAP